MNLNESMLSFLEALTTGYLDILALGEQGSRASRMLYAIVHESSRVTAVNYYLLSLCMMDSMTSDVQE